MNFKEKYKAECDRQLKELEGKTIEQGREMMLAKIETFNEWVAQKSESLKIR